MASEFLTVLEYFFFKIGKSIFSCFFTCFRVIRMGVIIKKVRHKKGVFFLSFQIASEIFKTRVGNNLTLSVT